MPYNATSPPAATSPDEPWDGGDHAEHGEQDVPRTLAVRYSLQDRTFLHVVRVLAFLVLVITGSIGVFLGYQSIPTLQHYGLSFFTEYRWLPSQDIVGIAAVLLGTIQVAVIALLLAFPLSLLTALFITDWAPSWARPLLVRMVDLMAAVPGIVFGLWVLIVIQPHATRVTHWISRYFDWIPFFHVRTDVDYPIWNQAPGYPAYAGSAAIAALAVAMMIFPMATSVMREVFSEAPVGEKEAALALGATRWSMVRTVVLPFGRGGIIGGTMLALGRALGETISVVMVISQAFEIKPYVLESGTATISALIASGFKEASPAQLSALLTAGFVLFVMTLVVNSLAAVVVARSRGGGVTEL
ncbi:phosphate ABC transporter permease subunit PstC [Pimelobacter sp. 30-1]|uniref:phosphate ABC transporter permease subunit PstC n=1 Tax=Pimelobacter sp. 30-1 TaxID=2004991 RepID=UPI001C04711C|nr:phosphate ABC transporter permease subunit PstC [Pimelobacter sp. 30-1]MBU2696555.1 phosphate ABC transporter permease subunit PstC [Pimelobacter sp. 30-1]